MPLKLQIIRARECIEIGAHGHFDPAASQQTLARMVRGGRKRKLRQKFGGCGSQSPPRFASSAQRPGGLRRRKPQPFILHS